MLEDPTHTDIKVCGALVEKLYCRRSSTRCEEVEEVHEGRWTWGSGSTFDVRVVWRVREGVWGLLSDEGELGSGG